MNRDALVLAGGIIATIRGVVGVLLGITTFGTLEIGESLFPGYTAVIVFEFLISLALIAIGILAIVKSADPAFGGMIRAIGIGIMAVAVIDVVWAIVVLGGAAVASGVGSLVVLGLIGSLLLAGGTRLAHAAATPPAA
jgi:hypothetical protein